MGYLKYTLCVFLELHRQANNHKIIELCVGNNNRFSVIITMYMSVLSLAWKRL